MRPVLIVSAKKAEYNPDQNKLTIKFHFPKLGVMEGETGEIDLINGDVPRIIVSASAQVEVDRLEIKGQEEQKQMKKRK